MPPGPTAHTCWSWPRHCQTSRAGPFPAWTGAGTPSGQRLRGAEVVHEHMLLITATASSIGPLSHCRVHTCEAGCYASFLPLVYLDKILALQGEHLAILIQNHTQPASLHLALDRAESAIRLRRLAQPLDAQPRNSRKAAKSNNFWWWCRIAIFQVVGRNRYFHQRFCVITVPCV